MLTPAEADAAIAAALAPVSQESVPLAACAGCVLQADVRAERDAPPFDRVAMDGIAFAGGAGRNRFRIAAVQAAGHAALRLESQEDCFEVMTGAILPAGCDTVVPVEQLRIADGIAELLEGAEPTPWRHVHRRASDARAGDLLLGAGVRLGGPEMAIAASAGLGELAVSRAPRIAVISTASSLLATRPPRTITSSSGPLWRCSSRRAPAGSTTRCTTTRWLSISVAW